MAARWKGLVFSRDRLIAVGAVVVLVVVGFVLPYLTIEYVNNTSELVRPTARLSEAARLLGGLDPTYLPSYSQDRRDQFTLALNVMDFAPNLQQVAGVAAVLTCWGQFADEINKLLWWPFHFTGYVLAVTPVFLFVGLHLLRQAGVSITLGPGWVPGFLAGVVVLVVSFRSYKRMDTYGGF